MMSLNFVRLELRPRYLEAELQRYMDNWLRKKLRTKIFEIDDSAREAIEHVASRGFIAGKVKAARETETPWQIISNDSQIIEDLAVKYENDFEKIMHDTRIDIILDGSSNWDRVRHRLNSLSQVLVWTAYRKGKASEYKRSSSLFQAQRYKYEGQFYLLTAIDERVCVICMMAADQSRLAMTTDYDMFTNLIGWRDEGYHIGCRCEIIATPTVKLVKEQDRFIERSFEEEEF